jgi:predicted permease
VLATRLGGNGPLVAFIISAGTLVSIITLPVWLLLAQ